MPAPARKDTQVTVTEPTPVAVSASEADGVPAVSERPDGAAGRLAQALAPERIDALLAEAQADGIGVDGPDGLIQRMTEVPPGPGHKDHPELLPAMLA